MEKSNFKIVTDEEIDVAHSGQYLLNLPIKLEASKVQINSEHLYSHPYNMAHLLNFIL